MAASKAGTTSRCCAPVPTALHPSRVPEQARNALRAVTKDEVRDILRRLTLSVSYLLTKEDAAHAAE
ncbi:MAG: hypothetical protein ACLVJH_14945 [Faecalibacterium prausnitzii]